MPRISIAVPVYNREKLLVRTLDSVLAQTFQDFECIISDNKSTDGTLEVAREYARRDSRFRVVELPENIGPVKNWINAVEACTADLVKILFSDDWMEPDCLASAIDAFNNHPDIGFVYFYTELEGRPCQVPPTESGLEKSNLFIWRAIKYYKYFYMPVSPTSAVFRKEDVITALKIPLKDSIGFEYLQTGAGYDQAIYLNAADRCNDVYYICRLLAHYGRNDCSITVSTGINRPGYLVRGYLNAKLFYLRRATSLSSFNKNIMKIVVYMQLIIISIRRWQRCFTDVFFRIFTN